jgi:proteic killer suppression protein
MIASFGDRATADLFHGRSTARVRRLPQGILVLTLDKLDTLNAAHDINDLRSPPGNRLHALRGKLRGSHSIRVNDQWRIVFRWSGSTASDVRLTDYH